MGELQQEKWIRKFGAENVYNKYCDNLIRDGNNYKCKVSMEMIFCNNKCAYATNVKGTCKVDKRGKVTGLNE